jgi:hypothetical protein
LPEKNRLTALPLGALLRAVIPVLPPERFSFSARQPLLNGNKFAMV